MDHSGQRVYEMELWDINGQQVADISHLAKNRSYSLYRNNPESLTFDLNLPAFERYCAQQIGAHPRTVLEADRTEIRVKRGGSYMFGVSVAGHKGVLAKDAQTLTVRGEGYLNLFATRYITKNYYQYEATSIARDLITTTQSQTNGHMGVTLKPFPYLTGKLRDRNYLRDEIKTEIQRLTALIDGNFDFKFDADKSFQVYEQLGSVRRDLSFIYGVGGNVTQLEIDTSGTTLFNKIIALGSGFGLDQLVSDTKQDVTSQLAYYLREGLVQFNSVEVQDTLDKNAETYLSQVKDLLAIPVATVTGKEFDVGLCGVGDRIPLKVTGHPFYDNIDGLYRVEKMDVDLDDNDFEQSIKLYFDNYGVDQNELLAA